MTANLVGDCVRELSYIKTIFEPFYVNFEWASEPVLSIKGKYTRVWISQKRNSCETKIKIRYRFICCNALFAQYFCKHGAAAQHTRKHNFVRSRHALLGKLQLQLVNLIIGIKCSYSESRSIETCYYCVMAFWYVVVTVPSIFFFFFLFFWLPVVPLSGSYVLEVRFFSIFLAGSGRERGCVATHIIMYTSQLNWWPSLKCLVSYVRMLVLVLFNFFLCIVMLETT